MSAKVYQKRNKQKMRNERSKRSTEKTEQNYELEDVLQTDFSETKQKPKNTPTK